jgi:polysaccharide biosynthesis/export protein
VVKQKTSLISVLGDVNLANRIPANHAGERLLDVIARVGGPKGQGFDTWVMLERNGRRAAVPFGALVYEPSNNIYAHPGDTVFLYREPQTFIAFGATGHQGQVPFDAWRVSLAEAVAKSGGLNDDKADPGAVFLYRGETRKIAEQLGIDVAKFQGPIIPVVYMVNFRDPASYFLATKFSMRNKDVIYISNSFSVESSKAMNYFRTIIATANDPVIAATNALIFRNLLTVGTGTTLTTAGGTATGTPLGAATTP